MSTSGLTTLTHQRYRHSPGKPLTRLPDIRKHFYVSELIPVMGLVLCSFGTGVYFSQGAAKIDATKPRTSAQIWPFSIVRRTYWDGPEGLREIIHKELRNCIDNWNWNLLPLEQI
ncbi:hypothetical protein RSOLAG1IB_10939 [Rhizoctonia solani AG-1 IB]|uniref:Uncharacterized protein n=1 Tax=Thanatephorus cucumeris (strain AG1-IB / isolate 7/3/14) TaxID=1108050 RepID=A0A0B7G174_THACB|nr:hypothetical protein RSOLAG1IB_10939 [Rhizoctonia solani AG-1 IB]